MIRIKIPRDYVVLACAFIICTAAIAAICLVTYHTIHENDEKDQWSVFADKANAYTDYILENGNYHKTGEIYYISWNETSCTIGGVSVTTSYRFDHTNYAYPIQYTSEYETLTYGYVFADEDCLRIEWHNWNKSDVVYPSDPSKDTHVVNKDRVIRTQYIPYSSITNMTVNEVIE